MSIETFEHLGAFLQKVLPPSVTPCVSLPLLPSQPIPHSSSWRYSLGFSASPYHYLTAWSWRILSHGKFWSTPDDRQPPHLLSINFANFLPIPQLTRLYCFSPLPGFDSPTLPRSPTPLLPVLSCLPSLYSLLPFTCVDKLLPAFANPSQTPSCTTHHKCQNSPWGPKLNRSISVTESLEKHTFRKWHSVTYRVRGHSPRKKPHIDGAHCMKSLEW